LIIDAARLALIGKSSRAYVYLAERMFPWYILTRQCLALTKGMIFLIFSHLNQSESSFKHCPDNLRRSILFLLRGRAHVEATRELHGRITVSYCYLTFSRYVDESSVPISR
jgi:hypothetical protein